MKREQWYLDNLDTLIGNCEFTLEEDDEGCVNLDLDSAESILEMLKDYRELLLKQ